MFIFNFKDSIKLKFKAYATSKLLKRYASFLKIKGEALYFCTLIKLHILTFK